MTKEGNTWITVEDGRIVNLSRLRSIEKVNSGWLRPIYEIHLWYPDGSREIIEYGNTQERDHSYEQITRAATEFASPTAQGWMGIESAPKGRKILVAYRNPQGNWRRVCARYYEAETLENETDGEWCEAGWYEECEGQETIFPVEYPPELWCELPPPPTTEVAKD